MVRVAGAGRTRDLILRGRRFDASQAEQWGVVSEIAAPGEHIKHATAIAREIAEYSPLAVRITKQVIDVSLDAPREAALLLEQLAYAVLNNAPEED
jgi:Enoyl-CoA hydratase/carnithine racemase